MARLLIASLVAFALFAGVRTAPEAHAAMDLRQIVVGLLEAQNRGDVTAYMSYYHDDVRSSGTASCDPACGKAGIEADFRENVADLKPTFKVLSMRETQTGMGYGKVEFRSDLMQRTCGVSRAVLDFTVVIVSEKIWRETVDFDRRDAETAKLMACFQGMGGGMPRPMPPRTGDGPQ